ncbi:UNVERIFIED_CONTAM: hypothetical protein HDU68_005388 [Siphonaria sp. JEL0065]|nr:hypothetical protein HDU68_005388 [Siphonaria sp. JEL0065]
MELGSHDGYVEDSAIMKYNTKFQALALYFDTLNVSSKKLPIFSIRTWIWRNLYAIANYPPEEPLAVRDQLARIKFSFAKSKKEKKNGHSLFHKPEKNLCKPKMEDYKHSAYVVSVIHNMLRRANESLIANCNPTEVNSARKLRGFVGFLGAYTTFLHHHHHNEDAVYFPVLAKHGINCDNFTQEHKELEPLMEYVEKIAAISKNKKQLKALSPATFDFDTLKKKLQEIANFLNPHLDLEETEHTPDVFLAANFPVEELHAVHDRLAKEAQKNGDPTIDLPFMALNVTAEEKKIFLGKAFPWVVLHVVIPLVTLVHRDYWQFSFAKNGKKKH